MYRRFLIGLLGSFLLCSNALPAEPGEKADAAGLWNQAMERFSARSYKSSAKLLNEYVEKYPGTPESVDARYFLAQSHLFSKNAKASIPFFTAVIEIRGRTLPGNEARTYLGQAYLDESKFSEAYLVSEELLSQETLNGTFRAKALLLRAHAQAGLKQNFEAEKSLVAFQAVAENDPELEKETAGSFLVSLLLKANHCDALPSAKSLPEDQVVDQIARKGVCILEMATLLVKASKRLSEEELSTAGEALTASLADYRKNCEAPPLSSGKVAKAELAEKLLEGYKSSEKLITESFRDRDNLKPLLLKIGRKTEPKKI